MFLKGPADYPRSDSQISIVAEWCQPIHGHKNIFDPYVMPDAFHANAMANVSRLSALKSECFQVGSQSGDEGYSRAVLPVEFGPES